MHQSVKAVTLQLMQASTRAWMEDQDQLVLMADLRGPGAGHQLIRSRALRTSC